MTTATRAFRRILFVDLQGGAEPSRGAIDTVDLARRLDAAVTVLDVVGRDHRGPVGSFPGRPRNRQAAVDRALASSTVRLDSWRRQLGGPVRCAVSVRTGHRSEAVRREVAAGDHDVVVVSSQGRRAVVQTIRHLLRSCPRPLLVMRDGALTGDVIALVDVHDDDDEMERVVTAAGALAAALDRRSHVVCAVPRGDRVGEWSGRAGTGPATTTTGATPSTLTDVRRRVCACVDRAQITSRPTVHVALGPVVATVDRESDMDDATLIVIARSGRRALSARIVGSLAERLLASTTRSVLVLEPRPPSRHPTTSADVASRRSPRWRSRGPRGPSLPPRSRT
ncbi:universal stress protein [Ilumatobacter sp.]|uniref:universal stress protein n=1 Tax=Ilumatobacter sp. TaxID=1967498 RepID=UPI003B5286D6